MRTSAGRSSSVRAASALHPITLAHATCPQVRRRRGEIAGSSTSAGTTIGGVDLFDATRLHFDMIIT
jgi:hypothetical protein